MKIRTESSIEINKSTDVVYKIVSDLRQWNTWSPWIHCEPTTKTELTGQPQETNQVQTWNGEVIGSGKMSVIGVEKNKSVSMSLEFFKPFTSTATVQFTIDAQSPMTCSMSWVVDSNLPFFMFFFKKMMIAYMNNDLARGLRMLKEYAETGTVVSESIYQGEKTLTAFQLIGKRTSCKIADLSTTMQNDFRGLNNYMNLLPKPNGAMAIYHKFDIPNGDCEYTAGVSFAADKDITAPSGLSTEKYPEHKGLVVDYYGPYRNLGNPWGMMMSYQRGKKKKLIKDYPMYEKYLTLSDGRPENEIHTQIIAPIKN